MKKVLFITSCILILVEGAFAQGSLSTDQSNYNITGTSGSFNVTFNLSTSVANISSFDLFLDSNSSGASAFTISGTSRVRARRNIDRTAYGPGTNQVTVNLSGVTTAQHLVISLDGVQDTDGTVMNNLPARMDVLIGDVSQSGAVDSADVGLVQRQNIKPVTSTNFRMDVNASGNIDSADVGVVQRQSQKRLP